MPSLLLLFSRAWVPITGSLEFARNWLCPTIGNSGSDRQLPMWFSRLSIGPCRKPRLINSVKGVSWLGVGEWRILAPPRPSAALPGSAPFPVERWRPPQVDRSCCSSPLGAAAAGAPAAAGRWLPAASLGWASAATGSSSTTGRWASAPGGSGEGGAALACGSRRRAGRRGSRRVTSTPGRSRGCRAPRSRRALQAPAAATRKGGRAGGSREEEEGRRRGCSRRTGDTRAGKARDLNLSLTHPQSRSLPSSFLTALPQGSRTEPGGSCPLSLLLWAGWGVLSCRGRLVCARRVAVPCCWELPRRAAQDPSGAAPRPLSFQRGRARRKIKLYPSLWLPVCVCARGEPAPSRWMLHCFRRQAPSSRVLKGAFGGPFEGYCISVFTRTWAGRVGSRHRRSEYDKLLAEAEIWWLY